MSTERGSMPGPGTPLIARERELSELRDVLQAGQRLVTLTGPGGTGKSRLSIALANDVAASFGGGAWFVDLTGIRDAHLLLSAIARTLGVHESGSDALAETLHEALRREPTLLVLDNFEQVVDAAGSVASLLVACPALVVVVTSREALGVRLEQVFPVSTLGVPDLTALADPGSVAPAVTLFVERAAARRRGFALTAQNIQRWPRSARGSTGCRWPLSWPRPRWGFCRPRPCCAGCWIPRRSWSADRAICRRATRRSTPRSTGATSC